MKTLGAVALVLGALALVVAVRGGPRARVTPATSAAPESTSTPPSTSSSARSAATGSWGRPAAPHWSSTGHVAFDSWVERASLTPDQLARALQVVADAQATYEQSQELLDDLRHQAFSMRERRRTPAQRAELKAAARRLFEAQQRHDEAAAEAANAEHAKIFDRIDAELEASAPTEERDAYRAIDQVDDDLTAQVRSGLSEFLTPRQLEIFDAMVDVPTLLEASPSRTP